MTNLRSAALSDYDNNFKNNISSIFKELNSGKYDNCMYLAGPSSYIFSTDGVNWGMDLQIRRKKDLLNVIDEYKKGVSSLKFILITHQHDDHMCIPLMHQLKDLPIKWFIPKGVSLSLIKSSGLDPSNIIFVKNNDIYHIDNIEINVFDSPHIPEGSTEQFAQCGYYVRTPGYNLLFPADVRNYKYKGYPDFPKPDALFSHLWLGNNAIDKNKYLSYLDDYVDFTTQFDAKKIFIGHLYEIGRTPEYMWTYAHAGLASDGIYAKTPNTEVIVPRIGKRYSLGDRNL